jgi:hypothetical protein
MNSLGPNEPGKTGQRWSADTYLSFLKANSEQRTANSHPKSWLLEFHGICRYRQNGPVRIHTERPSHGTNHTER